MEIDWSFVRKKVEGFGILILPFEGCEIKEQIGSGVAMNVYKGTCKIENQFSHVAFKEHRHLVGRQLVPKDVDQILDQFRHEIKLMVKMRDHPNVIQIHGVAFKEEKPLLVVELAYATLDFYLKEKFYKKGPVSWIDKTTLCLDVLSGVRGLSEAKIIHGDLKSRNVLVLINEVGVPRAKISDFGYSSSMSSLKSVGGTLRFLAPENTPKHPELSSWRKKTEQDIYGLGMVTFQVATDGMKIPYEDIEDVEDIYAAKDDPEALLMKLPFDTPEEYQEIVRSTTQVDPCKRASLDTVDKLFKRFVEYFSKQLLEETKKRMKDCGAVIIPFEDCGIDEFICRGQTMDVHKGIYCNKEKEKEVAFKRHKLHRIWIHMQQKDRDDFICHLCKEIELMKKLQHHPNIVQILGVTFNRTMPILLVELADDTLDNYLADRLAENQPMDWFDKTNLCLDVLRGVRGLNDAGIIHGDLKGASVLVFVTETEIPRAKLSDFGGGAMIRTSEGTGLSQWINGLGMVIFQIATDGSRSPYEDEDDIVAARAADPNSMVLLQQLPENTPEEYRDIILGTTKFELGKRISLDSVEKLLREALKKKIPNGTNMMSMANTEPTAVNDDDHCVDVGIDREKEAAEEDLDVYKKLSADNVDYEKAIFSATEEGDKHVIKLLLSDYGVDLGITDKAKGLGLVHYAAKHERTDVIEMLVDEFGMDVNAKDNFGRTALHYAAKNGNVKVVKFLADLLNTDKGAVNYDGWAAMHYAARYKHIDVINALTNGIGVDVNIKDGSGRTAIYIAARQGSVEMVQKLLALKADINITTWDGWTPLHAACHNGDFEMVQLLLNSGADINRKVTNGDKNGYTALDFALFFKHDEVVEVLVETHIVANSKQGNEIFDSHPINEQSTVGDDIEKAKELLNTYIKSKRASTGASNPESEFKEALFWAAELGYNNVIRLLASEHKVEVAAKDSAKGLTAIHFAARNGRADTIKMLVKEFNMEVNVINKKGTNPIHYAAKMGHIDIIKMLIKDFSINMDAEDNFGRIAIHYAAKNGKVQVIEFLISISSTVVNAVDNDGCTSLHYAARYKHIDVIKTLTNVTGIDVDSTDSSGRTAMYIAARQGNVEILQELTAHHANVNKNKLNGWTPLHTASYNGRLETVQLLIRLRAEINTKITSGDRKGSTPLDCAVARGNADVIEVIKSAGGRSGRKKRWSLRSHKF